jgi:hypothetical protein
MYASLHTITSITVSCIEQMACGQPKWKPPLCNACVDIYPLLKTQTCRIRLGWPLRRLLLLRWALQSLRGRLWLWRSRVLSDGWLGRLSIFFCCGFPKGWLRRGWLVCSVRARILIFFLHQSSYLRHTHASSVRHAEWKAMCCRRREVKPCPCFIPLTTLLLIKTVCEYPADAGVGAQNSGTRRLECPKPRAPK